MGRVFVLTLEKHIFHDLLRCKYPLIWQSLVLIMARYTAFIFIFRRVFATLPYQSQTLAIQRGVTRQVAQ